MALSDSLLEKYKDELPPPIVVDLPEEIFGGPVSGTPVPFHLLGFLAARHEDLVANAPDQTDATVDQVEEGTSVTNATKGRRWRKPPWISSGWTATSAGLEHGKMSPFADL